LALTLLPAGLRSHDSLCPDEVERLHDPSDTKQHGVAPDVGARETDAATWAASQKVLPV
jgi:hypothetical protein